MKYLLTPASSVASERAASILKNLVGDKRTSLGDDYLTQRLFLKSVEFELIHTAIAKAHISVPMGERLDFSKIPEPVYTPIEP